MAAIPAIPFLAKAGAFIASNGGNILQGLGSLLGGGGGIDPAGLQLRAAKNAIQWRVEDARKAGIHPLYALGAPGISIAPTGGSDLGPMLAEMGQDINRARMATADRQERARLAAAAGTLSADQVVSNKLQIERQALENDMLRSQIARMNNGQLGPASPSMGAMGGVMAPDGLRVQPVPAQPVINSPYNDGREAGVITDFQYSRDARGFLVPVPSNDVKNRIEDSPMEWTWWWRNNVLPNFGDRATAPNPREFPLPRGFDHWEWSIPDQAYRPARRERRRGYIPNARVGVRHGRDY